MTQLTDINSIIAYTKARIGITEEDINLGDWYEWIAVALEQIGGEQQFCLKTVKEKEIVDYRIKLECDYYEFIRFISADLPVSQTTVDTSGIMGNLNLYGSEAALRQLRDRDNSAYNGINHSLNSFLNPEISNTHFSNLDYRIENRHIIFSINEGKISYQYWAIPTNDEGLPLVPDNAPYKEACTWFLINSLNLQGYTFKNPQLSNLEYTSRKWNFYCLQARSENRMPNIHEMERMKNEHSRLLPITNHYRSGFRMLGTPEIINRHGRI